MNSKKVFVILSITLSIFLSFLLINNIKSKALKPFPIKYDSSIDIFTQIRLGYNKGTKGPMSSIKGTLFYNNNTSKDLYWIFLSGYDTVPNQTTDLLSFFTSSLEQDSSYKSCVVSNILRDIPYNSNIILSGHSLGGIVAQQIANDSTITKKYNILYTITYGAPLMSQKGREGKLKRFIDLFDGIPRLGIANFTFEKCLYFDTEINAASIYRNPRDAHYLSYSNEDTWGQYDVLGTKDGNTSFIFTIDNIDYYKCLYNDY